MPTNYDREGTELVMMLSQEEDERSLEKLTSKRKENLIQIPVQ